MAQSTTGKRNPWDQIPDLPADHPLFKRGYVIGMRRSGSSSTPGATPNAPPPEKGSPLPTQEDPKASSPDTSKPAAEE